MFTLRASTTGLAAAQLLQVVRVALFTSPHGTHSQGPSDVSPHLTQSQVLTTTSTDVTGSSITISASTCRMDSCSIQPPSSGSTSRLIQTHPFSASMSSPPTYRMWPTSCNRTGVLNPILRHSITEYITSTRSSTEYLALLWISFLGWQS